MVTFRLVVSLLAILRCVGAHVVPLKLVLFEVGELCQTA